MPPRPTYNERDLLMACMAVLKGQTIVGAAKFYNVNRSTLFRHIQLANKRSKNFRAAVTDSDERRLQNWILRCWHAGFTSLRMDVISAAVYCICNEKGGQTRITEFTMPWFYDYCERHPLVCETIVNSSHYVDFGKDKSGEWLEHIGIYLRKASQDNVLEQPSRIFHCVQVKFGAVGVILSYSASGMATPPLLVLPIDAEILLPTGWACYQKTDQDTDEQVLQHYLQNVLHVHLTHSQVDFPVAVCLDHQEQLPGIKFVETSDSLDFLLVNLYESAFKDLSSKWTEYLYKWASQNAANEPDYGEFIETLKNALVNNLTKSNIKNSFREAGLYPYDLDDSLLETEAGDTRNVSASNFNKACLAKIRARGHATWEDQITLNADEFQDIVGPRLLKDLENYDPLIAQPAGFSEEFLCLYEIYKLFKKLD